MGKQAVQALLALWISGSAMWISLYESQHLHTWMSKMPDVELWLSRDDGHHDLESSIYNSSNSIRRKLKNP